MLSRAGLVLALVAWAAAAQAGPSTIQAEAYGKVPKSGPIRVESLQEDSPLTTWLVEQLAKALVAKGYKIDERAPLYLRFQTTIRKPSTEHGLLEFHWGGGEAKGDIFALGQPDELPKVIEGKPADLKGATVRFVLQATVSEAGQAPLWSGELHREGKFDDTLKIEAKIAGQLVDTIGQTLMREQE